MTNQFSQHGSFNIGIQDNHAPVNITQILSKSLEYKDLLNQLEMQRELFAYIPEDKTEKRLQISQEIARLTAQIEQFKADVTRLAAEFNRIEINTDRLRRAKAHFEQGEIAAARAVFDSEREQMQDENNRLVQEKEHYEQNVLPKLKHNSYEFFLRALLERTAYDNPNWLADTCEYFERSMKVYATKKVVFLYALFLQEHQDFIRAEIYYQKFLYDFASEDASERAMVLNSLAVLHSTNNELDKAEAEYSEALAIRRRLAIMNPAAYRPDVAMTLNNMANWHKAKNELEKAKAECVEALEIFRELAAINRAAYLPYVAGTLNNLAVIDRTNNESAQAELAYIEALAFYRELADAEPLTYRPQLAITLSNLANVHSLNNKLDQAEAEYSEALTIRREFAALNPSAYLHDLALTLGNLANFHRTKKELRLALEEFSEALAIYRKLLEVSPTAYWPSYGGTLANIAIYYFEAVPNRELSIDYAIRAIKILHPIVESVPYAQNDLRMAISILQQGWGLSVEDIERMLSEAAPDSLSLVD